MNSVVKAASYVLSYAAIIVAFALALCQLIYFIIEKKENHHEHL